MDVPAEVVPKDLIKQPRRLEMEGRFGSRRLLRTGAVMVLIAGWLWLAIWGAAIVLANRGSDRAAEILFLTFTVLLWPVATLGVILLLCWVVMWLAAHWRKTGSGW